MPLMPLGKHKGEDISDVPRDYLVWLASQDWPREPLRKMIADELDRRSGRPRVPEPPAQRRRPEVTRAESASVDMAGMAKEQNAFVFELEIVRDHREMLEDIINRGERDRLTAGQGVESVKRLCLALKRILGISPLHLRGQEDLSA